MSQAQGLQGPVTAALQGFPLSPQQRRLWALRASAKDGPDAFLALGAIRIEGPLDPERLRAAVAAVVSRHEILRTAFRHLPGMSVPLQVIAAPEDLPPAWVEPAELGGTEDPPPDCLVSSFLARFRALLRSHGGEEPPLRVCLVPLAGEHLLLAALPGACADAGTLDVLAREIAAGYHGEETAEPMQYADFAAWQNEVLGSEEAAREADHWRRQDLAPLLSNQLAGFAPAVLSVSPGEETADAVRTLARRTRTTPEAALLACWYGLLSRMTGHARLAVGVLCPGREFEELAGALGPFARHLPVAVEIDDAEPASALLAKAARALAEARQRQDGFTWERLAEQSGEEGLLHPLWAFDWEERSAGPAGSPVRFSLAGRFVCGERFELKLAAGETLGAPLWEIYYDASRIDEAEAGLMAQRLPVLLREAAARPEAPLGDLEILAEAERRQLAALASGPRVGFPGADLCLHQLVEEQAARTPDAPAVRFAGESVSYRDLLRRADALARRLARRGVGPETRVALLAERSPEMVAGLLGILKAGGAWVPLDPDHPAERLAAILEDTDPPLVLAQGRLLDLVPAGRVCLALDAGPHPPGPPLPSSPHRPGEGGKDGGRGHEDRGQFFSPLPGKGGAMGEGPGVRGPSPDNLAYVIYTSGSTGRPKGVMVSHRAICNRLLWMQDAFPLGPGDRVLQKTPVTFDASIWEIFSPLLAGAELVLARPGGHRDLAGLAETAAADGVTTLQLVPSLLRPFLEEPAVGRCRSLRRMFCGGEELPADLARRFFARMEGDLCNLYGPTEAAIDATCRPLPRGEAVPEPVPIGRPLANVQVYVANARLRPAPAGAPGELLLGGAGLARGYLGRPDWTAERFLPDPWSGEPGARLYCTGDLGRRLSDGGDWQRRGRAHEEAAQGRAEQVWEGEIEYLGRIDRQVKVRGVRIEPREIEARLAEHPGVREVAVAARGQGEERRLVAYVVPAPDATVHPGELREFLAARLPAALVPAAFAVLGSLPRTSSGKVDWNALPEPAREGAEPSGGEPRTPTEQILAGIWAEVLGRERVGAGDHFFALGGHSLAATQVISRVRKAFGIDLRVHTLFDAPTVAGLAAEVDRAVQAGHGVEAPPIERTSREGPLPLSFAQERLWFLEQLRPGTPLYNIPDAVRFRGRLEVPALAAALTEVVRRHEALRTTFRIVRGKAEQVIGPPAASSRTLLPLVDLSALPPSRREPEAVRRTGDEAERPFNLNSGPLLRVVLLRLAGDDHAASFTVHHIVSDAWSTGLLVREVGALYRAFQAGEPSPLPELPLQYADFAAWQRRWLQGEALARQIDDWRRRLAGAPPVLDLPADRPRPERPSYRGATRLVLLPEPLADSLRALGRREGATLFMVVLAAFEVVLRRLTGRDDLVVGTDVANRNRGEVEELIGFFVNQLALRTDLSGDPTFLEVLARVRETALAAYALQDVPFELVVEAVNPERSIAHAPLFQVKLFLENTPPADLDLPGLRTTRPDVDVRTAKLDLTLALWERPEGLSGWINYSTDLFDAPRITRLVKMLTTLAGAVAARPGARLSELDEVFTELEQRERAMEKAGFKKLSFQKFQASAGRPSA